MPGQQQHSLLPQIFPNTCIDNAGPKHMHHSCPWRFFIVKSGSQARLGAMGLLLQISTLEQPRITQTWVEPCIILQQLQDGRRTFGLRVLFSDAAHA